jgi:hypothetical protein
MPGPLGWTTRALATFWFLDRMGTQAEPAHHWETSDLQVFTA